jgi:hypothetical protein
MKWVAMKELSNKLPIPDGYRIEQLKRSEIPEVIRCFRDWFPDITVGAESCYQREDFYSREVFLEGEPERDVIVLLFKKDQELVAIVSLQRSEDTLTLYGRLGAIAPRYRGAKLAYIGPALGGSGTGDGYGSHLRSRRIYDSQHADGFGEGGISDCRHRSWVRATNGGAGDHQARLRGNLYQSAGRRRRDSSPASREYDTENQGPLRLLVRWIRARMNPAMRLIRRRCLDIRL